MSVSLQEQETVINMSRDLDYADIYTSDRTVMTRLDKLAEDENCPDWSCTGVQYDQNGELVAKTYRTKKSLVSYRSSTPKTGIHGRAVGRETGKDAAYAGSCKTETRREKEQQGG